MRRLLFGSTVPLSLLAAWEWSSRAGALTLESLSRPSDILRAGYLGVRDGTILVATEQTLETALLGLAIAALAGILFGALLGLAPILDRVTSPTVEALRAIPAIAFMPLALMMFGFGIGLEASIVAYACVWPILIVTVSAVRSVEPRLMEVADALQLSFRERLVKIIFPAAMARINVGVRIAAGIALVVAVTVEIVVNPRGLGYALILAQQSLKTDVMYAQLLWLCVLGVALNAVLRRLGGGQHVLWRPAR